MKITCIEPLEKRTLLNGDYLLIPDFDTNSVKRYDGETGAFVDNFVPRRSGGLNDPWSAIFSPNDGSLLVASGHFGGTGQFRGVLQYDGTTGALLGPFVQQGLIAEPHGIIFGPDGNLYVGDRIAALQGRISRFDGVTGQYLDDFVPLASGGLGHPVAQVFAPSVANAAELDLYVADRGTQSILRYDGTSGAFLGAFVGGGSGGMGIPRALTFGPDGNLYVASSIEGVSSILRFQGPAGAVPGEFIDVFVPPCNGDLRESFGLLFGPDGNGDQQPDLYVNTQEINPRSFVARPHTAGVLRFDGITGAFIDQFVAYASGGLKAPGLMTFASTDPVTLEYTGAASSAAAAAIPRSPDGLDEEADAQDTRRHLAELLEQILN